MKTRKGKFVIIAGLCVMVGALFILSGCSRAGKNAINIAFTLDEFSFMGHSITEGDKLNQIMAENNIDFFSGAVCDKDYYAHKDGNGHIEIMCPAYHQQDDADDSTVPVEERRRAWTSGYAVTDTSIPGNVEIVSITAYSNHKNIDDYYEGPINIGDTMDEVRAIMQIDNIKATGIYDSRAKYETYSFSCNQGKIMYEEKCSGRRDEYDSYSDKLAYLADGHKITYIFKYPKYRLGVVFGEDGTVNHIAVTYDPEGILEKVG